MEVASPAAHGLHHDQLLPPEDGARALRGGTFAAAGQEHAGDRGWRDRRAGLTAPTWRPTTYWTNTATAAPVGGDEQDRGRTGLGRDALWGGSKAATATVVPRLVGFPLKGGQRRAACGNWGSTSARWISDEGSTPPEPEGCPASISSIPRPKRSAGLGSRVDLRLTLDEKKSSPNTAPSAEKQAKEAAEERLQSEREHADSLAQAEFRAGGGRLRRGTARRFACGSRKRRRIFFD